MVRKIAIIGLGSIGTRHLKIIKQIRPDIKVVLVRSGNGGYKSEEKLADNKVYSIKDAIKLGIQAAIISSPAVFHIEQVIELFQSGIHVFVEKPLSNSLENSKELNFYKNEKSLVGLLGYCLRYHPAALRFKDIVNSDEIGTIFKVNVECKSYLPDWRPNQDYRQSVSVRKELGGGVLLELSHELDYTIWFFGKIISVDAEVKNSGILGNVDDSAKLKLKNRNNVPISICLDFNNRNTSRKCIVHSSEGQICWDIKENKIVWRKNNGLIKEENYMQDYNDMYIKQLQHYFDCIEKDKEPKVKLIDGINVLEIVEAAKKSSNLKKIVALT